ncbi:uncharacterized protein LOC132553822 [Ylistrum balloti]|uniref:uncharacterized protein LOC132553822 n=1 Tax=Ylistrum balloti TaxID=509963 RepID=UPI00290586C8|nr:uncharacterized protein LOC132553822 [Ylistrum balloti]
MASFSLFLLTVTVILKRFSPVDGHGLCFSNIHQELHSYYKTFMHLETIGVLQCIKECNKHRLCQKINHDRVQLTCDLMMTYAEEGKVTSLLDVASVQMDNSKCLPNSCSETQVCVDMRDGGHTCLDQAVCPAPDWVLYSNKCYFFRQSRSDADESEGFCGGMNAKLVRIDNDGVKAFLKSEIDRRAFTIECKAKQKSW